ncbi:hypothetical protein BC827DRAFT_1155534 [Russula dissimulans]|nr:hypothetical protein BC827DRAFT_1155534 [Russula dissimulans]
MYSSTIMSVILLASIVVATPIVGRRDNYEVSGVKRRDDGIDTYLKEPYVPGLPRRDDGMDTYLKEPYVPGLPRRDDGMDTYLKEPYDALQNRDDVGVRNPDPAPKVRGIAGNKDHRGGAGLRRKPFESELTAGYVSSLLLTAFMQSRRA